MLSVMKAKVSFLGCWANTLATSSKEDTILQNGGGLVTRINEGSSCVVPLSVTGLNLPDMIMIV